MKKTDWEKELDERFDVEYPYIFEERNELKSFIRSQRSQLLKSLVEEVEKLKVVYKSKPVDITIGHNNAIQDVIKLLEREKNHESC